MKPDAIPLVLAITGASGTIYGARLLDHVVAAGIPVHLVISNSGRRVWRHELESDAPSADAPTPATRVHEVADIGATIASGSFRTLGMVVAPCSMGTLARIASGISSNLIERAADVTLKERRPLVLVPRETPLSRIHARNLLMAMEAGALVMPACPSFYGKPATLAAAVDTVLQRVLDHLGIELDLARRWQGEG